MAPVAIPPSVSSFHSHFHSCTASQEVNTDTSADEALVPKVKSIVILLHRLSLYSKPSRISNVTSVQHAALIHWSTIPAWVYSYFVLHALSLHADNEKSCSPAFGRDPGVLGYTKAATTDHENSRIYVQRECLSWLLSTTLRCETLFDAFPTSFDAVCCPPI